MGIDHDIFRPHQNCTYRKTSNIRRTLVANKIVDHSDVVGASPVGAAPTTSSFSTWHLASKDSAETAARQENLLSVGIWCVLYLKLDGHRVDMYNARWWLITRPDMNISIERVRYHCATCNWCHGDFYNLLWRHHEKVNRASQVGHGMDRGFGLICGASLCHVRKNYVQSC